METTEATKVGDILYIKTPKKKFVPSYVYYLLEYFGCTGVCFGMSKKIYNKEDLKGKDEWNGIK